MNKIEKLQELIGQIDVLITMRVTIDSIEFKNWYEQVEFFLKRQFGSDSEELKKFSSTHFSLPMMYPLCYTEEENIEHCKKTLLTQKTVFKLYLEEIQEKEKQEKNIASSPTTETLYSYSKVFIVHGHNGELKQSVARLIEKQGIEAIILDEQANQGRTIIEKFEGNSDVGGAICLFTADDLGRKNGEEEKARARQNVVFEAGYFMGKLGRDHVVIIAEPEIELPSDLSGIVYSNKDKWKIDVLNELDEMGYSIDMNKLKNKNR